MADDPILPLGTPRSLVDVAVRTVMSFLADLHTVMPGQIVDFDPKTGLASITPMVDHQLWNDDGTRTYETYPTLTDVPIGFTRGGGFVVSLPMAKGDYVLVLFNESSIDEYRQTGQVAQPQDSRRHSIGWPWALPCGFPDAMPLAEGDATARGSSLIIGKDGSNEQIRIASGSILLGADASEFVAMADKVNAQFNAVLSALTAGATGCVPSAAGAASDGGKAGFVAAKSSIGTFADVSATLTKAR